MKIAAVIAECNPFHEGHAYLIKKLKEEAGADYVLLLLSGDFVQRGVPAVADKYVRTDMALRGGADLVLSYPVRFATSAAPDFAEAAVRILNGLGCVDILGFGTENTDLAELSRGAELLEKMRKGEAESEAVQGVNAAEAGLKDSVGQGLRSGLAYPGAVASSDPLLSKLLGGTGNILALEYIKALRKTGSGIAPYTVQRTGTSASTVREILGTTPASYDENSDIPEPAKEILLNDIRENGILTAEDLSVLLYDRLLNAENAGELLLYSGMTESLANAAYRERFSAVSFTGLVSRLHTKDRTAASVQRALLHAVLGLRKRSMEEDMLYTQILGFRESAAPLLTRIGKAGTVPVLAKAAQAGELLPREAYETFREEMRSCELYSGLRALKAGRIPVSEYTRAIVKTP